MKKIILLVFSFLLCTVLSYAGPDSYTGLDDGDIGAWENITISSEELTCVVSTGNVTTLRNPGMVLRSDPLNTSYIQVSSTPHMRSCVAISATTNGIFSQAISTTTLKAATTVWTTQILVPSPFTNVTAAVTYTVGTATAVFVGTCTIKGIDDTYATVTEYIDISTTTATGSKIWVLINSISWKATTVVGPPVGMQQPNATCIVGTGSLTSKRSKGNIGVLYPGETISFSATKYKPVFMKVKETQGPAVIYILKLEEK